MLPRLNSYHQLSAVLHVAHTCNSLLEESLPSGPSGLSFWLAPAASNAAAEAADDSFWWCSCADGSGHAISPAAGCCVAAAIFAVDGLADDVMPARCKAQTTLLARPLRPSRRTSAQCQLVSTDRGAPSPSSAAPSARGELMVVVMEEERGWVAFSGAPSKTSCRGAMRLRRCTDQPGSWDRSGQR